VADDTKHLRVIAAIYRETWGVNAVNAGYIDWAADEIDKLRAELYSSRRSLDELLKQSS
jgi:hypothetical protein